MKLCECYNVKRGRVCGLPAVTYLKLGKDATREYLACNAHTLNAANANRRYGWQSYEWRRIHA